ncbi:MAG: DEAD/DEAH box helicase [Spirochaetales bacterium]|nr:DEAD/DEAH box helicase [Spirochaetales bacterium]
MSFTVFGLNPNILKAIEALGFEHPTPVQEKVIPHILSSDRDMIGLAETGSGKTAAFGLPILSRIDMSFRGVQALILCPTRELCLQITRDMGSFSKYISDPGIVAVYGGSSYRTQKQKLKEGARIVVATPGRLVDLIGQGIADISRIWCLVLDEADIMLNMGFKEELEAILEAAPEERQTLLLSATMSDEVARIASRFLRDPAELTVGKKNVATASVEHTYYMVHARDKFQVLKRLVDSHPGIYGLIFTRTRGGAKEVADKMIGEGYNADALHGDLSQDQREYIMGKFRERKLQLLVATDIAARGLDVQDLTHVIHYDLPDDLEIYNHRSGRTGRAGKTGQSLAIINMKEKYKIRRIEMTIGRKLKEGRIPGTREICEAQLLDMMDRVTAVEFDEQRLASYLPAILQKLDGLDREDLIKRFISLEFNRFLDSYRNLPDLTPLQQPKRMPEREVPQRMRGERKGRPGDRAPSRRSEGSFMWLTLNAGKIDGVTPPKLISMINSCTRGQSVDIGKIDIGPDRTRFQVESGSVDYLLSVLKRRSFQGKRVKIRGGI